MFLSEPQDICVIEGQDAFFPCEYNGTDYYVKWKIKGKIESTARLPRNHRPNATGLIVRVDTSVNQSTYSCIIRIASVEGEITEFESNTAILTVVSFDNSSIGTI